MGKHIGKDGDWPGLSEIHASLDGQVFGPAIICEIGDAEKMQVRTIVPKIRQRRRHWRFPDEKKLEARAVIGEIGKTNDHFFSQPAAHPLGHGFQMLYLLQTLVKNHIIKGAIFIV